MYKRFLMFCSIIAHTQLPAVSWNPLEWGKVEQKSAKNSLSYLEQMKRQIDYRWLKSIQKQCNQRLHSGMVYAKQHAVASTLLAGMLSVFTALRHLNAVQEHAEQESFWFGWQNERLVSTKNSTEEMYELLHAIQVRYIDIQDITDFVGPIKMFMQDIDKELKQLHKFSRYAGFLRKVGLSTLVDTQAYGATQRKIERLTYLKSLCVQWLSKTKLTFAVV